MKKKVLIIGGYGFMGRNLCEILSKNNFEVSAIVKKVKNKNNQLKNIKFLKCDISNFKNLAKIIKKKYNIIINCSGNINHSNKKETYNSHYKGIKNILQACKKIKLDLFIQLGSSLEYGNIKSPHKEITRCSPISHYGKAKYLATKFLVKSSIKTYLIFRLYQLYGPYQKSNRLIPFVVSSCLKNKSFNCSDGEQLRDFLYVDDFSKLILKILKNKKKIKSGIYNVGNGNPVKVRYVINKINKILKKGKPNFGKIKMRKDEINVQFPNVNKLKETFNWSPKVSLNSGIIRTIKFYRKFI